MDLSIIIPIFNEEENIVNLHRKIKKTLTKISLKIEVIFIDDGSIDNGLKILKEIKDASENNQISIRIVQLSRNFGQHPAIIAGFSVASGDTIITMDADLQIDPVNIIEFLKKIEKGYDFVGGIRRGEGNSFFIRRILSRMINLMIIAATGKKMRDYGCPFNAIKKPVIEKMQEYGEMQRFYKPLAVKLSENVTEIDVTYSKRVAGNSKYGFLDLVDFTFDFITNFSKKLFQRVVISGLALSAISLVFGLIYLTLRFPLGVLEESMNRLLAVLLIGFMFGVQLFVMGVLGDFIIRIYRRLDSKPIFDIKKIW